MRCKQIQDLFSAYANSELPPELLAKVQNHLVDCAECQQQLAAFTETRQQLAELKQIPEFPDMRQSVMLQIRQADNLPISSGRKSNISKGVKMAQGFIFSQSKWRIATVGGILVALVITLSLILPSSGGYDYALAEAIAQNSPEVKAAFGDEDVIVLQVIEDDSIVVCSSEMQPPVAVKVDLKSKTVIAIADVELPELTDAEKELAIDLAKSSFMIQPPIDDSRILKTEVYPVFVSGTVSTDIGELTLLPGPKMAIVKFELDGDGPYLVTAKVDLDAGMVKETSTHSQNPDGSYSGTASSITMVAEPVTEEGENPGPSRMEQMQAEGKAKAISLIEADTIGEALLDQGLMIQEDDIRVTLGDTYLESDDGETIVVSTPISVLARLSNEDEVWAVSIDLLEEALEWWPESEIEILAPYKPEWDIEVRQAALEVLSAFDQTADLLDGGAKPYSIVHRKTEYTPGPKGGVFGFEMPSNFVSMFLTTHDNLYWVQVDIASDQVIDFGELPSHLHLSPEEKGLALGVMESQPEVIDLLDRGAEIVFLIRDEYDVDDAEKIENTATALLYIEETNEFWSVGVETDTMTFLDLTYESYQN